MFKQGQKVFTTERIQVQGDFGWEHKTEESEGVYHSCNSEGIFVQVKQGDRLKLFQYPNSDVYIKLEQGVNK